VLQFDGTDDYVVTNAFSIPNQTGTLSISAWVNNAILGQYQSILSDAHEGISEGYI